MVSVRLHEGLVVSPGDSHCVSDFIHQGEVVSVQVERSLVGLDLSDAGSWDKRASKEHFL